jgi:hypothetical protein
VSITGLRIRRHAVPSPAVRWPVLAGGAALCCCVADTVVNPYRGQTPECPFHALTGLWCPGCGAARSLHSFLHGDLTSAMAANPLFVVALPVLLWAWTGWLLDAAGGPHLWRPRSARWTAVACVTVALLFGLARNLPFAPFRILSPH